MCGSAMLLQTPVLTAIDVAPPLCSGSSTSSLPLGDQVPLAGDSSSETDRSTSPSAHEEMSSAPRSPPELERVVEVEMDGEHGEGSLPPHPTNRHPSLWNVSDSQWLHTTAAFWRHFQELHAQTRWV